MQVSGQPAQHYVPSRTENRKIPPRGLTYHNQGRYRSTVQRDRKSPGRGRAEKRQLRVHSTTQLTVLATRQGVIFY